MYDDLVQEIQKECKIKDIDVAADFALFLVNLTALGRTCQGGEDEDGKNSETEILTSVIEKLLDQSAPRLVTLRIQFHFAKHYRDRDTVIRKHRSRIKHKTAPLVDEICETDKLDNAREIERLYQKMLVVITLLSGLGNPTIPTVLREVAIALQSVLQPSELPRYIALSSWEKAEQLWELVYIVAGIRLFNRDCERGGEGIDDLPSILQTGVSRMRLSIVQLLESLMSKVYQFTAAAETAIRNNFYKCWKRGPNYEDVFWFIEMLTATRQQEIYIRKLLSDLEMCEEEIRSLINRIQCLLIQLHATVKYRTAVPTNQVYPQFIDIAEIWLKLQDQVIVLTNINDMFLQLRHLFPEFLEPYHRKILKGILREVEVLTDAQRLEKTMGKLIVNCGECPLAYPSYDANFDKMNLQLLGFCITNFVLGKGALIPGNPNIGVAEWKGKCFAFSSVDAARTFGENPDSFTQAALDIIKEHQEYIHLFQIFNDLHALNNQERLAGECCLPLKIRHHQEVQTEMHVFPTFIDLDYSSSIWEHKRRALHFASICQSATRSTQTYSSHFRNGINLQTLEPVDKAVQTKKDSCTNTQMSKKYIFGLRGRNNDVQFVDYAFSQK